MKADNDADVSTCVGTALWLAGVTGKLSMYVNVLRLLLTYRVKLGTGEMSADMVSTALAHLQFLSFALVRFVVGPIGANGVAPGRLLPPTCLLYGVLFLFYL